MGLATYLEEPIPRFGWEIEMNRWFLVPYKSVAHTMPPTKSHIAPKYSRTRIYSKPVVMKFNVRNKQKLKVSSLKRKLK